MMRLLSALLHNLLTLLGPDAQRARWREEVAQRHCRNQFVLGRSDTGHATGNVFEDELFGSSSHQRGKPR